MPKIRKKQRGYLSEFEYKQILKYLDNTNNLRDAALISFMYSEAILLGDSIVKNSLAVKEKINVSPQETAVAPNLTVKENLQMFLQGVSFGVLWKS